MEHPSNISTHPIHLAGLLHIDNMQTLRKHVPLIIFDMPVTSKHQ